MNQNAITNIAVIQEVLTQPQHVSWLPWAVQYFFFVGIATCATLYACWQCWRGMRRDERPEMLAVFIAITAGITAPVALTADLHQTARVWHFYAYPTPWSWMPWGAVFLPLFTGFLGWYFAALLVKQIWGKQLALTRWLALGSALMALGLLLYTGREASVMRARPVWFSDWFAPVMLFSAMQVVPALLRLGLHSQPQYQRPLALWQITSLLLFALCLLAWVSGDTLSGAAIRGHLHISADGKFSASLLVILWLAALAVTLFNIKKSFATPGLVIQAGLAIGLAWYLRWVFLIQGQTIPKYNAMYNPYDMPAGTDGIESIIGTFCLWIALMIIIQESVRWLNSRFAGRKVNESVGGQHGEI